MGVVLTVLLFQGQVVGVVPTILLFQGQAVCVVLTVSYCFSGRQWVLY